ncbi:MULTISPECIES: helix-turn-helix domain-containing protein [unclassified Oceanispirochaeta]|uniref:helix-turn-helix domain-containing protein n=1 Tax=unclassified Oceanispirochaeta TaxID=2635722 RepID=UPI000E095A7C|nr:MULTISPECIES: helix-turn-helix domain-containing protein [unclassified Oceanispirochaeta]MBF9018633.1 helix-turn-helix domain-containing protein [Oceanispirochaeta sp. M2]NPD75070.1 helix-turn-helix domain-containing protein [Oceanispirochaeta sp. M1]RDG29096.1 DNA-binding protein [Oceanispirochaeta sp. M1]
MNEYKMELSITCATGDADHFYNTVLMIAKGFEIGVLESKLGSINPGTQTPALSPVPELRKKKSLTILETSEYLNLSKATLYKYTSEARIPHYKIGSRILFNVAELDEWLEDRKVKSHG